MAALHPLKVAVIGRGLIGGSIELAARRAGHEATVFRGRGPLPELPDYDLVFVAVPPEAVVPIVRALAERGRLKEGAVILDIAGIKRPICAALAEFAHETRWHFVGGHPMAGKEKVGYDQAVATLFDGASMILTPYPETPASVLAALDTFFRSLGFGRVVMTDPAHHDEMIAFTSQLCHLISSAYVREPLSAQHAGYSAGSFRDMVRVGAPEPDTWTQLFFDNRDALLPVLDRYLERLQMFRTALAADDRASLHRALETGVVAKARIDEEKITL